MKTTWQKIVTKIPGRRVQGGGYDVEFFSPNGIRYYNGDGAITLWSAILKGVPDEDGKRSFWIFDYVRAVYLPSVLSWDDGGPLNADERAMVLAGIRSAHKRIRNRVKFIVDDEMYRRLEGSK